VVIEIDAYQNRAKQGLPISVSSIMKHLTLVFLFNSVCSLYSSKSVKAYQIQASCGGTIPVSLALRRLRQPALVI
jgi:hypothetical protein